MQWQDYVANGLNQYETVTETSTTTSLTYDANGNLITDGTWTYSYDVENRLVKAVGQGKTITHEYGPKGRRVASHSSVAGRTEYMYEGDEPIADYDGNDNLLRQYVNGAGIDERLLYIQYDANGDEELRQYYHANHQGTIIAMSNGGQLTPAKKYTYDSYGVPGEPEDGQPFRYTGRRWDSETGLYYYRARYYSAKLGRFLQTDPIGYEDNMNLYGYTANDPVNRKDPSGLEDICITVHEEKSCFDIEEAEKKLREVQQELEEIVVTGRQPNASDAEKRGGRVAAALLFVFVDTATDTAYAFNNSKSAKEFLTSAGTAIVLRKLGAKPGAAKFWKSLKSFRGPIKTNGLTGKKKRYYQFDRLHNEVEVFDSKGQHLGSMDPQTGKMIKGPVKGRYIDK